MSHVGVSLSVQRFRDLSHIQININFLSWGHREQDAPEKIIKDSKGSAGSTGVRPKHQIRKKA